MFSLSYEFFPPKDEPGTAALSQTILNLALTFPAFMTVTFGAGGTTRTNTIATIQRLQEQSQCPIGSHLTYHGILREELLKYADNLWNINVRHIVALRGDPRPEDTPPAPNDPAFFHHTSEFVHALKQLHPFTIYVGTYPDVHPNSVDQLDDLLTLKEKVAAGADAALTQFFFDNTVFYKFRDDAERMGITTPIHPGILPIHDFARTVSFAAKCGAKIPPDLADKFSSTKPEDHRALAIDLLAHQLHDLSHHGVKHLHLYTLNKSELVLAGLKAAGLR